jgi:hypothetical protein
MTWPIIWSGRFIMPSWAKRDAVANHKSPPCQERQRELKPHAT